jgi:uncharacterized protein (DUF433 family)
LRRWETDGVFRASFVDDRPRRPYRRLYTFQDLVSLRTLAILRRKYKVDLAELKAVGAYLRAHYDAPWSEVRFKIVGRHIVFDDPVWNVEIAGKPLGQRPIPFAVEEVASAAATEAEQLRERRPDEIGVIVRHRHVMHNAWVVAGTRIPTSAIWNFHDAGCDADGIIAAYPQLTPRDVQAAIAHEAKLRQLAA